MTTLSLARWPAAEASRGTSWEKRAKGRRQDKEASIKERIVQEATPCEAAPVQAGQINSVEEQLTVKNVKAFYSRSTLAPAANEVNKANMLEKFSEYAVFNAVSTPR